jgi:hypothetical protein
MITTSQKQNDKSKEQALTAFVQRKAEIESKGGSRRHPR